MRRATNLGLAALMLGALSIRLWGIEQPLVQFHATRHYRSAIIARALYNHAASGIPAWAVRVADANVSMQPTGEPPFMEWLACASYLGLGHENIAIPRAFAAVAWVAGAVPLFLLALRIGSPASAWLGAVLYLFLPYGIVASRNFQPDALMTLSSLWALLAIVRRHERSTGARLCVAAAAVGIALLVKPMSVFLVVPVLIGVGLSGNRARRLAGYRPVLVMLTLSFVAPGLYYGYGAIFGTLARDQMHMRFVPSLLPTAFFWRGLATQIHHVFTLPLFLAGLLGIALAPRALGRVILASLWIGYAAFAVAFTYHMPTHDYYHWPYIAAVALGIAAVVARIQQDTAERFSSRSVARLVGALCVAIAAWGTWQALPRFNVPYAAQVLAQYGEIGELTNHDTRVLFLDTAYGYPLMYHGELSGDSWPNRDDLAAEAMGGEEAIDAGTRFSRDYADYAPRYFVVTDLASLKSQPDLQLLLAHHAVVVGKTRDYQVYKFTE